MRVRLDQHVPGQHRAVHDAGPVGQAERHEQPPPHPGRVAWVQPVGVRAAHVVQAAQPGYGGQLVDLPLHACRRVAGRVGVDQPRHVREVLGVAVLGDPAQRARLAGHQVVVAGVPGHLEQPPVAVVVQVGDVARVHRGRGAPARGDGDERFGGGGAYSRVGRAQTVGVQRADQLAVAAGRLVRAEQVGVGTRGRDQPDRLFGPHRTVSSRAGRSSAGCSSRASPAR